MKKKEEKKILLSYEDYEKRKNILKNEIISFLKEIKNINILNNELKIQEKFDKIKNDIEINKIYDSNIMSLYIELNKHFKKINTLK